MKENRSKKLADNLRLLDASFAFRNCENIENYVKKIQNNINKTIHKTIFMTKTFSKAQSF